ncbi:MAG: ferritin family protein [Lachnospiraceae bacterium]|nr:ferritin family protein [Lachnospiraceae bacterium]
MQENSCNFSDVRPVILPLAYPPIQINKKNQACANMLSVDYCGAVSEMSAITQYINNEIYLSAEKCPVAKIILGIAMAEMIHLQKLGEMIYLLGGSVDFVSRQRDGRRWVWSPQCLTLPRQTREILMAGIESEKAAINQYEMHRKMITDTSVNAVLARIIKDEEYHIMLLQAMLKELS